jgi:hypothetical protein
VTQVGSDTPPDATDIVKWEQNGDCAIPAKPDNLTQEPEVSPQFQSNFKKKCITHCKHMLTSKLLSTLT